MKPAKRRIIVAKFKMQIIGSLGKLNRTSEVLMHTRVDPFTSILAVLARSCQILTTSWQDSY